MFDCHWSSSGVCHGARNQVWFRLPPITFQTRIEAFSSLRVTYARHRQDVSVAAHTLHSNRCNKINSFAIAVVVVVGSIQCIAMTVRLVDANSWHISFQIYVFDMCCVWCVAICTRSDSRLSTHTHTQIDFLFREVSLAAFRLLIALPLSFSISVESTQRCCALVQTNWLLITQHTQTDIRALALSTTHSRCICVKHKRVMQCNIVR